MSESTHTSTSNTGNTEIRPNSPISILRVPSTQSDITQNETIHISVADSPPSTNTPQDLSASNSSISDSASTSNAALPVRTKRGYRRPQGTLFSDSAKNRESVMSLGTIAHLQYYFARTGLLDGKGAQLAPKDLKINTKSAGSLSPHVSDHSSLSPTHSALSPTYSALSPTYSSFSTNYSISENGAISEAPSEHPEDSNENSWDHQLALFPPTFSTYNQRLAYVPPPPDLTSLRRELTDSLENALKALKDSDSVPQGSESQGFYEIQGLHILDTTTLAIRAARTYYTTHSHAQRLHSIKSERKIRSELYHVLDILKRLASRNFAGGLRPTERIGIIEWVVGISELISTEIEIEKREIEEQKAWSWRSGDWTGKEKEREEAFLQTFVDHLENLPPWMSPLSSSTSTSTSTPPTFGDESSNGNGNDNNNDNDLVEPTPFLQYMSNGLCLIHLHNNLVRKSPRSFELIRSIHTDTSKPYRRAENLRFWVKAAQLRWDLKINFDVMAIATQQTKAPIHIWKQFDQAIFIWCRGVREAIDKEWDEGERRKGARETLRSVSDSAVGINLVPPEIFVEEDHTDVPTILSSSENSKKNVQNDQNDFSTTISSENLIKNDRAIIPTKEPSIETPIESSTEASTNLVEKDQFVMSATESLENLTANGQTASSIISTSPEISIEKIQPTISATLSSKDLMKDDGIKDSIVTPTEHSTKENQPMISAVSSTSIPTEALIVEENRTET